MSFNISSLSQIVFLTLPSTATIAVMLDHAFGIFNNVSPRFQWAEIDLPFPSDDRFFEVASYAELRAQSLYPVPKMKVKDAYLVLFTPLETAEQELNFLRTGNLTPLDMQMLIHCKSSQITAQFPFPNISQIYIHTYGRAHFPTPCAFSRAPASRRSFDHSDLPCATGVWYGTISVIQCPKTSGINSASSERPSRTLMP